MIRIVFGNAQIKLKQMLIFKHKKKNLNFRFCLEKNKVLKKAMVDKSDVDVDKILEKLLDVRGAKPGKQVNLSENEIKGLISKSRDIFINQPMLLELEAPIKICGI